MPDENKFAKLREIGYVIRPVCHFCIHAQFGNSTAFFGTCGLHKYQHLKHDNPDGGRGISICRIGSCPDVKINDMHHFGSHAEFVQKG